MSLPPDHILAGLRPSPIFEQWTHQSFDTTTLTAHDFDVDPRTGFMPPEPPVARLPLEFSPWEDLLDRAIALRLPLSESAATIDEETRKRTFDFHQSLRNMPIIPITSLLNSETQLRRAHLVLAFLLHFYVHSQLQDNPEIHIPAPLTLPILAVSRELVLPPVLTYSDTVLYNWRRDTLTQNLCSNTLFTGSKDEEHFYLTSAKIELAGVKALDLMQRSLDEAFVGDSVARKRIASMLHQLASVIKECTLLLDSVKENCDPTIFYQQIRPWFKGEDSGKQRWVFLDENQKEVDDQDLFFTLGANNAGGGTGIRELSGPSAGQSSLIHALDIFLGVDHTATGAPNTIQQHSTSASTPMASSTSTSTTTTTTKPFLERMQTYMPRHHRNFLNHLKQVPTQIRHMAINTTGSTTSPLCQSYNEAVQALREFRNCHIRIATLYIISQRPRALVERSPLDYHNHTHTHTHIHTPKAEQGTGGTDLVPFLKASRNDTTRALLS